MVLYYDSGGVILESNIMIPQPGEAYKQLNSFLYRSRYAHQTVSFRDPDRLDLPISCDKSISLSLLLPL